MVMANTERVARALGLLRDGLGPACEATWRGSYGDGWLQQVNSRLHHPDRQPSIGDRAVVVGQMISPQLELVLEVRAKSDEGLDETTRRTVSENARSLGAQSSEFE